MYRGEDTGEYSERGAYIQRQTEIDTAREREMRKGETGRREKCIICRETEMNMVREREVRKGDKRRRETQRGTLRKNALYTHTDKYRKRKRNEEGRADDERQNMYRETQGNTERKIHKYTETEINTARERDTNQTLERYSDCCDNSRFTFIQFHY